MIYTSSLSDSAQGACILAPLHRSRVAIDIDRALDVCFRAKTLCGLVESGQSQSKLTSQWYVCAKVEWFGKGIGLSGMPITKVVCVGMQGTQRVCMTIDNIAQRKRKAPQRKGQNNLLKYP
jgi:hypothetical protein